YNGHIYGSEIARGIDIFALTPSEHLTQNELDAAMMIRSEELNTQEQTKIVWPAAMPVARAYLDQLTRSKGIQPERARAVKAAIDRADGIRTGKERGAADVLAQLDAVVVQLETDAGSASGRDQIRLKALAATIKGRAAKLR
ncbi:MAG TPA: hypothetical protein VGP77_18315, partial [Vicinamibacterales bacterium]|nr:hypothetical protein [Vicinamibacterales bacterium]